MGMPPQMLVPDDERSSRQVAELASCCVGRADARKNEQGKPCTWRSSAHKSRLSPRRHTPSEPAGDDYEHVGTESSRARADGAPQLLLAFRASVKFRASPEKRRQGHAPPHENHLWIAA